MKSIFITGTDTGVGKTRVTELLLAGLGAELSASGASVAGMKPVETGVEPALDSKNKTPSDGLALYRLNCALRELASSGSTEQRILEFRDCCPFRFRLPASPLVAAADEGRSLDFEHLLGAVKDMESRCDLILIEGAGGLLVPLTDRHLQIDLIQELRAPALLVTRPSLGTLNHTLLSLEALARRNIPALGIVINHSKPSQPFHAFQNDPTVSTNRIQMEFWAKGVPILGEVPFFERTEDLCTLAKLARSHLDLEKIKNGICENDPYRT